MFPGRALIALRAHCSLRVMSSDLAHRIRAAFSSGSPSQLAELYEIGAVLHHPLIEDPVVGREAIMAVEDGVFTSYSDHEWTAESVVAQGNLVALRYVLKLTNTGPMPLPDGGSAPATNRRVEFRGASFFRLSVEGLIAEEHRFVATDSLRAQLGFEPLG